MENDSLDFDFTEGSIANNSEEENQSSQQDNNTNDNKKKQRKKEKKAGGTLVTNSYINKLLIATVVGLIVTILCVIVIKPKKVEFQENRTNNYSDDIRIFDDALAFTVGEKEELREQIAKYEKKLRFDIAIATVEFSQGDLRAYGENLYESQKLGWDSPYGDGLILVFEKSTDKIQVVTYGKLVDLIDDKGLKTLSKEIRSSDNSTYFLKSVAFLSKLGSVIKPTNKPSTFGIALRALRLAILLALFPTVGSIITYKKNRSKMNKAYLESGENSRINYSEKNDTFINSVTTKHKRAKSSSGGHTSSGGHRTGGGSL